MSVWSFQSLRNALVPPNDELPEDKRWMADIPFDTRQLSIKYSEAVTSFSNSVRSTQEPRCQGSRAKRRRHRPSELTLIGVVPGRYRETLPRCSQEPW
jgi:hypothetical protein